MCACICVCVCPEKVGLIRLTDSSHFSATYSSHLRTHTRTDTHTQARPETPNPGVISPTVFPLCEAPIAIAAITVKGSQPLHPPSSQQANLHLASFKAHAVCTVRGASASALCYVVRLPHHDMNKSQKGEAPYNFMICALSKNSKKVP